MNKNQKILILGGSGFIGSALLNAFANSNRKLEIYALENTSRVAKFDGVKKVKGSLFDVPKIIEAVKPQIIIHAARISGKNYPILGRHKAAFLGRRANKRIYKSIVDHNIKLVYISGSLMYGSQPGKQVTEDFPVNPASYAIDYQKAERPFLKNIKKAHIMICRPGWIFGPESWFKAFFEDIISQQGYVPQYGDGQSIMSIIHRDDLACLILEYVFQAPYSNVYNLISPIDISHKNFVHELQQKFEKPLRIIPKQELINTYGRVTCDALTCDIPLASNYMSIINTFDFKFKSVADLLDKE